VRSLPTALATCAASALCAAAPLAASAAPAVTIGAHSASVRAGRAAHVDATVSAPVCRIELTRGATRLRGPARTVAPGDVRLSWTVPRRARPGRYRIGIRCAADPASLRGAAAATVPLAVRGGRGALAPARLASLRLVPRTRAASERLWLTDALPPGEGDPSAYAVDLPEGVGGGGFASYWPLSTGVRARITEGQGGRYSHDTPYTRDAIDIGVPAGTLLRAGFTGVVARVSRGCAVGDARCGGGYGNYVYLKAPDGTCAVLGHMTDVAVVPGQQVPRYGVLGTSGTTGNSTGPHLHYDRVDCGNNRSLPWTPLEGGPLGEGATIVSQNAPEAPPAADPQPQPQPQPQPRPQPPPPVAETTGGITHTWSDPSSAGGAAGPVIPSNATVRISCRLTGFRVADGNTWWYRIASSPWNDGFYASADAFYNNGMTSGSLHGTPFVDPQVPAC
jgi:murein DD-endopeptidase MepM/ murein hydrolase activator NlpD